MTSSQAFIENDILTNIYIYKSSVFLSLCFIENLTIPMFHRDLKIHLFTFHVVHFLKYWSYNLPGIMGYVETIYVGFV